MKIALANGVFGEKMMVDSTFNCLVNDQGRLNNRFLEDSKYRTVLALCSQNIIINHNNMGQESQ